MSVFRCQECKIIICSEDMSENLEYNEWCDVCANNDKDTIVWKGADWIDFDQVITSKTLLF